MPDTKQIPKHKRYEVRELASEDIDEVLTLNNISVPAVNELSKIQLEQIITMTSKCWVIDGDNGVVAALLILGPGQLYQSDNYTWLEQRFKNYCYVDRIMVAENVKRAGLGRLLYTELENYAKEEGRDLLLCEVNVEPPNPQSLSFHIDLNWEPFQDREHGPGKIVRYFKKPIIAG